MLYIVEKTLFVRVILFTAFLCNSRSVLADIIFWQDEGQKTIQRANSDGSNVQTIFTNSLGGTGLAVDSIGGKVYWQSGANIMRSNFDGTFVEMVISSGLSLPLGITVDSLNGKLYIADRDSGQIKRSNLDGSGLQVFVNTGPSSHPHDIAIDVGDGKAFWTDSLTNDIFVANLDGSNVHSIIDLGAGPAFPSPRGIALDHLTNKVYWASQGNGRIQRANYDGSSLETIVSISGWNGPDGISVDALAGKLYWGGLNSNLAIQVSDLDGSNVQTLVSSGLSIPRGIEVFSAVPEPSSLAMLGTFVLGYAGRFIRRKLNPIKAIVDPSSVTS